LHDIAVANRLAHAVPGGTLDELPPQTRRLLGLLREMVKKRAKAEHIKPREVRFTRREAREATGWGDTQLRVHLGRLDDLEYVIARRDAGRAVYELAWSGEGHDGAPFVMGLIEVGDLEHAMRGYDDQLAGSGDDFAAPSRAGCGGIAGHPRDGDAAENPRPDTGFCANRDAAPESARPKPEGLSSCVASKTRPCPARAIPTA
jgi:DNA primase